MCEESDRTERWGITLNSLKGRIQELQAVYLSFGILKMWHIAA